MTLDPWGQPGSPPADFRQGLYRVIGLHNLTVAMAYFRAAVACRCDGCAPFRMALVTAAWLRTVL